MQIRKRKLNKQKLSGKEARNLEFLEKEIKKLHNLEDFNGKIGAEVNTIPEGSILILSAFSSELLSDFIAQLLVKTANAELEIAFDDKNNENLWSPTWTNRIKLHHVS